MASQNEELDDLELAYLWLTLRSLKEKKRKGRCGLGIFLIKERLKDITIRCSRK